MACVQGGFKLSLLFSELNSDVPFMRVAVGELHRCKPPIFIISSAPLLPLSILCLIPDSHSSAARLIEWQIAAIFFISAVFL